MKFCMLVPFTIRKLCAQKHKHKPTVKTTVTKIGRKSEQSMVKLCIQFCIANGVLKPLYRPNRLTKFHEKCLKICILTQGIAT